MDELLRVAALCAGSRETATSRTQACQAQEAAAARDVSARLNIPARAALRRCSDIHLRFQTIVAARARAVCDCAWRAAGAEQ